MKNKPDPAKKAPRKAAKKAVNAGHELSKILKPIDKMIAGEKANTPTLVLEVGKTYLTRCGMEARVLCLDMKGNDWQPVLGLLQTENGESIETWSLDGKYLYDENADGSDIISLAPDFDWSCLPPWINYIAMDDNGLWYGYDKSPTIAGNKFALFSADRHVCAIPHSHAPTSTPSDWRRSLRVRPGYQPE